MRSFQDSLSSTRNHFKTRRNLLTLVMYLFNNTSVLRLKTHLFLLAFPL